MKARAGRFLQRWPTAYRLASRLYWSLQPQRLAELFIGTKANEIRWAKRSIAPGYWAGRDLLSKHYLAGKIAAFTPDGILEIGCASGSNLYALSQKLPKAKIVGVDINAEAVRFGNDRFAELGLSNVSLTVGKADRLEFPDRSFDVVFTNALLIYIGPDKIREVARNMLRLARMAVVMMELHAFESRGTKEEALGIYKGGNWNRDYAALFGEFVRPEQIRITRIPQEVWPARPWNEYGAVVEIVLGK